MTSVGVIMTCFNEGPYIEEAVKSVLGQTRADLIEKIVIADDGSQQETLDVLAHIAKLDPRIEIIYGRGNGLPKGRNIASEKITSEWLAILDGDDIWLPQKIEKQIQLISNRHDVGLIYTGFFTFEDGKPNNLSIAKVNNLSNSKCLLKDFFTKEGPIIPSTILIKNTSFVEIGKFDASIKVFEDTEFYARMAQRFTFGCVPAPLIKKRNHAQSITAKRQQMLAHQAYVSFLIASRNPELIPLVPKRLARAARKLGNSAIAAGDKEQAETLYRFSFAIQPFSLVSRALYYMLKIGLPLANVRSHIISLRRDT